MSDEREERTFSQLGLSARLVQTLSDLGYEAPTPIQERTIPVLLAGNDLIGQAQTGTGKTAAFALPILDRIDPQVNETQALVLAPTRELAMQVAEAIHTYARGMEGLTVLPVYGGAPIVLQMKHLQRGAQIVVGTPGRLIDHLDRKTLRLASVRFVVLDEADEMLKMGFIEEVERILSMVPAERQVALFSATMPDAVARIAQKHLRAPERIEIEHKALTAPDIEQRFINVSEGQKLEVLTKLLELEPSEAALIFRRTKLGAAELAEKLQARGFAAVAMHGDMTQPLREAVIRRLRAGQIEIVVATDVAARGLDVEQITHVINYDIPHDVEAYVHRIGRTGRAGRSGMATLFITPRERRMMREIERFTGSTIKPMKMPTPADVVARRIAVFKESLRKNLKEGDLDLYVELVEQLAEEGPHDMADVAAAAARMANGTRSLAPEEEQAASAPARVERADSAPAPAGSVHRRPAPDSAERRPVRRDAGNEEAGAAAEPKVRLSMAVGKADGIRPADIVGSIANEADVPGREIGPIDIRENLTIVVIPARYRDQVLAKVAGARFRGRPLDIKVADGSEGPRAPFRSDSPGRPGGGAARPPARRPDGARPPARRPDDRGARPARPPFQRREAGSRPLPRRDGPPSGPRPSRPSSFGGPRRQDSDAPRHARPAGGAGAPRREGESSYGAARSPRPPGSFVRDASVSGRRDSAGKAPFYSGIVRKPRGAKPGPGDKKRK
jgi:ATP-dependent RNA helicase DeaD